MSSDLHTVSAQFLHQLNNTIAQLQTQEKTLLNDMENFRKLHELSYDIRYSRVTNEASSKPSVNLEKELKVIQGHLTLTLTQFHSRQRKRLLDIHSRLVKEEIEYPRVNTATKTELEIFSSRVMRLIEHIEILLI